MVNKQGFLVKTPLTLNFQKFGFRITETYPYFAPRYEEDPDLYIQQA